MDNQTPDTTIEETLGVDQTATPDTTDEPTGTTSDTSTQEEAAPVEPVISKSKKKRIDVQQSNGQTTLNFDEPVSITINGVTYEGTELTVSTDIAESIKQNLFDAFEIVPTE